MLAVISSYHLVIHIHVYYLTLLGTWLYQRLLIIRRTPNRYVLKRVCFGLCIVALLGDSGLTTEVLAGNDWRWKGLVRIMFDTDSLISFRVLQQYQNFKKSWARKVWTEFPIFVCACYSSRTHVTRRLSQMLRALWASLCRAHAEHMPAAAA